MSIAKYKLYYIYININYFKTIPLTKKVVISKLVMISFCKSFRFW